MGTLIRPRGGLADSVTWSILSFTIVQRQAILRAARQLVGMGYDDTHGETTWKDLTEKPRVLDCSTFVCRVAMEALGYGATDLAADAGWLLDRLIEISTPEPGDLVGYGRRATRAERQQFVDHGVLWHVMLYAGNGTVIGACDVAGAVVVRPIIYEEELGHRQWKWVGRSVAAFRILERS